MKHIVFGAGENAKQMIEFLRQNGCRVDFLVDNDSKKIGTTVAGVQVKSPTEIQNVVGDKRVYVSVVNEIARRDIFNQLSSFNLVENSDFFDGVELLCNDVEEPGRVSGYVSLPDTLHAVKTYDPASFLAIENEKKRIFRIVKKAYVDEYLNVLNKCKDSGLLEKYLVNTWQTTSSGMRYDLVLEHEFIEPISYCFEWSPVMIFDYVDFMLELIAELDKAQLGLRDGHTLNATIYKSNFVFIDFGAISPDRTANIVLIEFINTHILPLILFSKRQPEKAYMLLKNAGIRFDVTDIRGYLSEKEFNSFNEIYECAISCDRYGIAAFVNKTVRFCDYLRGNFVKTKWMGYQDDEWNLSNDTAKWSDKMTNAIRLMKMVSPKTVTDIAGNMGWYGSYLHDEFEYSIIIDRDYSCISDLWERCRREKVDNVYPITMSICSPTLPYYRDYAIENGAIRPWRNSAVKRFKTELVLALAIIHHLVFRQQLTFEEIIMQFKSFSSRYLLIEFIEIDDCYITDFKREGFEWYTKDNFMKELLRHFRVIEESESTPKESRTLYLCEKLDD